MIRYVPGFRFLYINMVKKERGRISRPSWIFISYALQ